MSTMKTFCLFVTVCLAAANAEGNNLKKDSTCKLASLVPGGSLALPSIDFEIEQSEIDAIDDPLYIKNTTVTVNERVLKGTYSLRNGVVEGLSTLSKPDFDFNNQIISFNASLQRAQLTGDYEIIGGQANLTTLGVHTFSGSGPLNASVTGVVAGLSLRINIDPLTQHVKISNLTIDFDFKNASIVAENLVVDDELVDWKELNQNIRPMFEAIWQDQHDVNVQLIQKEINRLLEGCTLMDLIELITSPAPQ